MLLPLLLAFPAALQDAAPVEPKGADVAARIEAIRREAGVPALGGALVTVDGLQGVWVCGTRRAGGPELVRQGDLWHLGSCTKAMTATLIALLVERGDLGWDALLGDLLPEAVEGMDLDYADVTLVEILGHRAGLAPAPPDEPLSALIHGGLPLLEQRAGFARLALAQRPALPPHGALSYSNAGYVIAGHVAEVAAKKPWEELIEELLFRPLGMDGAGFGPPGSAEVCDQPRGHTDDGRALEPGPGADNPPLIGPAGTVHASLGDWAKFAALHLRGARGDVRVGEITLPRAVFARLHSPCPGPGPRYGYGWGIETRPWAGGDGTTLEHNGSNARWYCIAWLGLESGVAVLVTANQATPAAKGACNQVAKLLVEEHGRRAGPR